MESGGPSRDDEEIVYEEEPPPAYVEERVETDGTLSRVATGLAVLAAAVGIVALVLALRANDGEEIDPAEVEQVEQRLLELNNRLDEVQDEAASGAALEERVDELSSSLEDLDARLTRAATTTRTLSGRVDDLEDAGDERDARLERTIGTVRELSDRVDALEQDQ